MSTRMITQVVFEILKGPNDDELLMDDPRTESWQELCQFVFAKEQLGSRARALKHPLITSGHTSNENK